MSIFYAPADPAHIKRERAKARELRATQWWKQKLAAGTCHFCEGKFKASELTMDHLVPIGRGGKSTKGNCVTSCKECNTKKGSKTSAELLLK
jgi:5-methylcytosine-specific restriction protein A